MADYLVNARGPISPGLVLRIRAAEEMIYDADFTHWSETAKVEMKIKIDCYNLMEPKD